MLNLKRDKQNYAHPQKKSYITYNNLSMLFVKQQYGDGTIISQTSKIAEIFGFASFLKEQQNCKIVFLMGITQNESDHFSQHEDKVIDAEITLVVSPQECINIVLPNPDELESLICQCCIQLNISNMRMIKKIIHYIKQLTPIMAHCRKVLKAQVIKSVVLFHWSIYGEQSETIPLDFILAHKASNMREIGSNHEDSMRMKKIWTHINEDYLEYYLFDDLDILIANSIKSSAIPLDEFEQNIKKRHNKLLKEMGLQDVMKELASTLFHDFNDNTQDVIVHVYEHIRECIDIIDQESFAHSIAILKSLHADDKIQILEDEYHALHQSKSTQMTQDEANMVDEHNIEQNAQFDEVDILHHYLLKIGHDKAWNVFDEEQLSHFKADNYFALMKENSGAALKKIMDTYALLLRIIPDNSHQLAIVEEITKALHKIAAETPLNRLRLEELGFKEHLED